MKANAPEKIYVHIKYKPCEITFSEVIEKECSNIEYIRTDAFIKKACAWLENNLKGIVGGSIYIDDFRNYMERE